MASKKGRPSRKHKADVDPGPPGSPAEALAMRNALVEFCQTIENTGGVVRDSKGRVWPVGDPNWLDLGFAYMRACLALSRKPMCENGMRPEYVPPFE